MKARHLDDALFAFWRLTERFEGIPPTAREFQEELGCSSSSVAAYRLNELEEAGLIYCPAALKSPHKSRTRQLSAAGWALALKGQRGTASALYGHEAQGRGR